MVNSPTLLEVDLPVAIDPSVGKVVVVVVSVVDVEEAGVVSVVAVVDLGVVVDLAVVIVVVLVVGEVGLVQLPTSLMRRPSLLWAPRD